MIRNVARAGTTLALALLLAGLVACEDDGATERDVRGDVGWDGSEDVAPDGLVPDVTGDATSDAGDTADADTGGCPAGSTPMCAAACGGDYLLGQAECIDDQWVCAQGVLMDDCPPGTCWGMPEAGEVCENGWQCHPERTNAFASCPAVACLECSGFEGPALQEGCTCACDGVNVLCEPRPECTTTSTSTLAGVAIQFKGDRCRFTLAEAATGLTLPYQVLVQTEWAGVIPRPQDAGGCDQPGSSGLILFERLSGGDQHYCVCDTGLCMGPDETPIGLAPGAYPAAFTWDGVNWDGPSDTGNPKGAPFPAGTYTLEVSARGKLASPPDTPFEVKATLTVILEE